LAAKNFTLGEIMPTLAIPNTFVSGNAIAEDVNENFSAVVTAVNGLEDVNISATANIAQSKIAERLGGTPSLSDVHIIAAALTDTDTATATMLPRLHNGATLAEHNIVGLDANGLFPGAALGLSPQAGTGNDNDLTNSIAYKVSAGDVTVNFATGIASIDTELTSIISAQVIVRKTYTGTITTESIEIVRISSISGGTINVLGFYIQGDLSAAGYITGSRTLQFIAIGI